VIALMKAPTPFRPLILLSLLAVLSACTHDTHDTPEPPQAVSAPPLETAPVPMQAHQRELTGSLLNIPLAADVELALLAIDSRGKPYATLGTTQLRGLGEPMEYRLIFASQAFAQHPRIELHGRALQAGKLILRLPPQPIAHADSPALGAMHLMPAP
jgi:uncharacterized lipoprotein YbaY